MAQELHARIVELVWTVSRRWPAALGPARPEGAIGPARQRLLEPRLRVGRRQVTEVSSRRLPPEVPARAKVRVAAAAPGHSSALCDPDMMSAKGRAGRSDCLADSCVGAAAVSVAGLRRELAVLGAEGLELRSVGAVTGWAPPPCCAEISRLKLASEQGIANMQHKADSAGRDDSEVYGLVGAVTEADHVSFAGISRLEEEVPELASSPARLGECAVMLLRGFAPHSHPRTESSGVVWGGPAPPALARRIGCPRSRGLRWRRPRGPCSSRWGSSGSPRVPGAVLVVVA
jgi:hypothetical protein